MSTKIIPVYTVLYATANDGEKWAERGRYTHSHHRSLDAARQTAESFVRGGGNGVTDGLFATVTDRTGQLLGRFTFPTR